MNRKEELDKIINDAMNERTKIKDAERIADLPKYVGKCFYNGRAYYIVTGNTKKGYLHGFTVNTEGTAVWVEDNKDDYWLYSYVKGAKEITAARFWKAYDKAMAKFLALRK